MPPGNARSSRSARLRPDIAVAIASLLAVAASACSKTRSLGPSDGAAPQDGRASDADGANSSDSSTDASDADSSTDTGVVDTAPPPPTFEDSTLTTACTSSRQSPAAPVSLEATFTCQALGGTLSVAASDGHIGAVAFSSDGPAAPFLLESSNTLSVNGGPAGARSVAILAFAMDHAFLVGDSVPGLGVAFYAPIRSGWMREAVRTSLAGAPPSLAGAALAANGHAFVLYDRFDVSKLELRERDADGTWNAPVTIGDVASASVVVGADSVPHVLMLTTSPTGDQTAFGVSEWQAGTGARAWDVNLSRFAGGKLPAVTSADGTIALAIKTVGGVHLVTSKAGRAADELLPDTRNLAVSGCPALPFSGAGVMGPTTCTEKGRGTSAGLAAAATTDGALWVAYSSDDVDRDVTQQCAPFEGSIQCFSTPGADRSKAEVVLVKRAASGATSSIVWRAPLVGHAGSRLALDARGTNLHLAFAGDETPATKSTIHYMILDATKL